MTVISLSEHSFIILSLSSVPQVFYKLFLTVYLQSFSDKPDSSALLTLYQLCKACKNSLSLPYLELSSSAIILDILRP